MVETTIERIQEIFKAGYELGSKHGRMLEGYKALTDAENLLYKMEIPVDIRIEVDKMLDDLKLNYS